MDNQHIFHFDVFIFLIALKGFERANFYIHKSVKLLVLTNWHISRMPKILTLGTTVLVLFSLRTDDLFYFGIGSIASNLGLNISLSIVFEVNSIYYVEQTISNLEM